jgi:hypothetical protein
MQAKTLRQANSQALILQEPRVISLKETEDLGKDKALKRGDVIVHQEALDGTLPLSLKGIDILAVARLSRSAGFRVWGNKWIHTSLDRAAIPKTRLS